MTRQEIENLLPYFCNPYTERMWRCELVVLDGTYTYSRANMASIIKYDNDKFINDINREIRNNEDLKNGVITIKQLEHAIKIKHSVLAESIEYVYSDKDNEHISHLFFIFLQRIGDLATTYAEMLKRKQEDTK